METKNDSGEDNWSFSTKFIVPAILSAVFAALYNANDNGIMHQVFIADAPLIPSLSYLFLGSWIGLLTMTIFTILLGKQAIDNSFKKIKWESWSVQKYAILSGLLASVSTLIYLWGSSLFDPSLTLPFASLVVPYLVIYDSFRKRVDIRRVTLPMLLVIFGAFLSTILDLRLFTISAFCLFYLLVIRNGLLTVGEILEQEGVIHTDAANFNFWRFFWLATTSAFLVGGFTVCQNLHKTTFNFIASKFWTALPWIFLTMALVYFSNGFKLFAKKHGPVSEISMLGNLQIVLGIPITLGVNYIKPGWFGNITHDASTWVIRGIGAFLILWGCILLTKIRFSTEKTKN